MCAKRGGPVNPDQVKVQFRVVPSSLSLAWKVPVAPVPLGGTSLKVESLAEKRCGRSSFCARTFTLATKAVASAKAAVTAILHPRFFMIFLQKSLIHWEPWGGRGRSGRDYGLIGLALHRPLAPRKPRLLHETRPVLGLSLGLTRNFVPLGWLSPAGRGRVTRESPQSKQKYRDTNITELFQAFTERLHLAVDFRRPVPYTRNTETE